MNLPELLLTCVLVVVEGGEAPQGCDRRPLVAELSAAIVRASEDHGVPAAVIAAVAFHESRLNPRAIGPDGLDIGLMQIRRGGAIPARYARWSNRALQNIRLNVDIGAAYLAVVMKKCPQHFLSRYNGRPCRPSRYSRAVLSVLDRFATKGHERAGRMETTDASGASAGPLLQTPAPQDRGPVASRHSVRARMGMPGLWFLRRRHSVWWTLGG